ncbi:DUF4148 domain-containing protein [Paraburkholderia phenazinium]|uniref:DUF4148 domain-containing protein n=1 Tax=Paraburkholderia phenazinium TaxID=60549 RepID=UPI0009FA8590|nr:DUF4148 domain-containing protein [Paraburkholderia phenazinium]
MTRPKRRSNPCWRKTRDSYRHASGHRGDTRHCNSPLSRHKPDTSAGSNASTPATTAAQPTVAAQPQQWSPNQINVTPKTRAEVRHELAQAEHDGEIARLNKLYQGG